MAATYNKRTKRIALQLLSVVLFAALILVIRLVEDIGPDQKPSDRFVVRQVVDGDTMILAGGDKLRLLSVDTPESGEPFYDEATKFLKGLTDGRIAEIEFANRRRDKYGRLLAYLYVDTLFVNKAILENGLGYLYLFEDTDLGREETSQLLSAQRGAMKAGIGIWSLARQAEEYYVAKDNSFRLHRPSCRAVAELKEGRYRKFASRDQGLWEGLSPCRNCKP